MKISHVIGLALMAYVQVAEGYHDAVRPGQIMTLEAGYGAESPALPSARDLLAGGLGAVDREYRESVSEWSQKDMTRDRERRTELERLRDEEQRKNYDHERNPAEDTMAASERDEVERLKEQHASEREKREEEMQEVQRRFEQKREGVLPEDREADLEKLEAAKQKVREMMVERQEAELRDAELRIAERNREEQETPER